MRLVLTAAAAAVALSLAYIPAAQAGNRTFQVDRKSAILAVKLAPGVPVHIDLESSILQYTVDLRARVKHSVNETLSIVELFAPSDTKPHHIGGTLIVATRDYTLYIRLEATAPSAPDVDETIIVEHAELVGLCNARDELAVQGEIRAALTEQAAAHKRELAEAQARHERELDKRDLRNAKRIDLAILSQVSDHLRDHQVKPVPCDGAVLRLCDPKLLIVGDGAILRFTAHSGTGIETPVTDIRVYNEHGENLVQSIDVGGSRNKRDAGDSVRGVIPAGGEIAASVKLRNPERLGRRLRLVVMSGEGIPVKEEYHLMDRLQDEGMERRRERARRREATRPSLHFCASYGAIWLPSQIEGNSDTAATQLTSVGVRWTEGLSPRWAIEVDAIGARSGTADFGEVSVDGTTGDLTRSAVLGRVAGGGVFRFGEIGTEIQADATGARYVAIPPKVVPNLRLGAVFQVANEDATLASAGAEMDGPEAGISVDGGFYGGAGIDIRLGKTWVVGAGFTFTKTGQHQIVDFGLNIAHRWDAEQ